MVSMNPARQLPKPKENSYICWGRDSPKKPRSKDRGKDRGGAWKVFKSRLSSQTHFILHFLCLFTFVQLPTYITTSDIDIKIH
jgi:hypothetical protein